MPMVLSQSKMIFFIRSLPNVRCLLLFIVIKSVALVHEQTIGKSIFRLAKINGNILDEV